MTAVSRLAAPLTNGRNTLAEEPRLRLADEIVRGRPQLRSRHHALPY